MTNEEAIELLCAYGVPLDEEKFCEALDMAFKALGAEQKDGDLISRFRDYQIEWLTSHNDIDLRETETWVVQFLKDTAECFLKTELPSVKTDTDLISRETLLKELSVVQNRPVRQTDVDLIRRTDLLNKIWQKEYGKDYDGVNMLNIQHIDIIEQMPSAENTDGDLIAEIDKLPRIKVGNSNSPTVKYCIDERLLYEILEKMKGEAEREKAEQTYGWCKGCKEYDTEKHCCHRYSSFIRETLQDNINAVLDDIKTEIDKQTDIHADGEFYIKNINVKRILDKHISRK